MSKSRAVESRKKELKSLRKLKKIKEKENEGDMVKAIERSIDFLKKEIKKLEKK